MEKLDTDRVGYKVRLFPTKEQIKIFNEYFGMSRFVYNLCIDIQEEQYMKYILDEENIEYKRLSFTEICKIFTALKKEDNYKWLNNYNTNSIRGAIKDCNMAYSKYDNITIGNGKPRYKSKIYSKKQFYTSPDRLSIYDKYVRIPSIGDVKYCNSYGEKILGNGNKNKLGIYRHYMNTRISYDGINYYLSFTISKDNEHQINSYHNYYENKEWQEQESSEAIGIDVGLKNDKWMVDSTGYILTRPNSDSLNKKINRLERKYDRQKRTNLKKNSSFMEQHPNGSKNMQKTREKINKCFKKITNRRRNAVHEYSCRLLDLKPKAVVMETISVKSMINRKKTKLNDMIKDAALYESMMIIENKMVNNGIPVIRADKEFPSSQLCSCCGYRQDIGKRKNYSCPNCGTIINRDLNAAINLSKLAY